MKYLLTALFLASLILQPSYSKQQANDTWPDGTPISSWFHDYSKKKLEDLGKQYVLTDYGVKNDSSIIQTKQIQAIIDRAEKMAVALLSFQKEHF